MKLWDVSTRPERLGTGEAFGKRRIPPLSVGYCNGLVPVANQYPWCSAAWFERTASPAAVKTIYRFKTDRLNIENDF